MKGQDNKHILAFRTQHLKAGEQVEFFLEGWIGEMMGSGDKKQQNGVFVLTNLRACFYRRGMLGEVLETQPISKITSIETKSMMGFRVLRLHTSHDDLAFKTFEEKDLFDRVYARLEELREEGGAKPQSPPPVSSDPIEQLRKLGELRDAGVVTDAEFAAKKAELLARL